MKSIKKDIVRTVTLIPAAILFSLFLTIDIVLDDWVKEKFDKTLITKSSYLKTLVELEKDGIEFDYTVISINQSINQLLSKLYNNVHFKVNNIFSIIRSV